MYRDCPLGNKSRTVLHLVLDTCKTFSDKIVNSGVTIAMNNYAISAALLVSLATRDISAVGTLRRNRAGLDGATKLWKENEMKATNPGRWSWRARYQSCGDHLGRLAGRQPVEYQAHLGT